MANHIRAKFHHARDLFEGGAIDPRYLNTKDRIADVLTKGLSPIDHLRICRKFMFLPDRRVKAEKELAGTSKKEIGQRQPTSHYRRPAKDSAVSTETCLLRSIRLLGHLSKWVVMVMGSSIHFTRQCETSSIEVECILLKDV